MYASPQSILVKNHTTILDYPEQNTEYIFTKISGTAVSLISDHCVHHCCMKGMDGSCSSWPVINLTIVKHAVMHIYTAYIPANNAVDKNVFISPRNTGNRFVY